VTETSSDMWATLGNRVFWIGIILGALLALILIWNPGKPVPRPLEEAPAWAKATNTSADGASRSASAAGMQAQPDADSAPSASDQMRWPAEARGGFRAATGAAAADAATTAPAGASSVPQSAQDPQAPYDAAKENHEELDAPPPGREAAPSFDEWSRGSHGPAEMRTARGGEATRWDGTAPAATAVPPGQAAPTGRILNPLVHE
jgi:hypothetical protein